MKGKILISACLLTGAVIISSCSKSDSSQQLEILHSCAGTVCSVELAMVNKTISTDLLGKEHVLSKKMIKATASNLEWAGISNYTTNTVLSNAGLSAQCAVEQCSSISNPTGGVFIAGQSVSVSVSGTIAVNGETIRVTNYTVGGNWVVPQPLAPTSLTYTCPAGATDTTTYTVPGTSGISLVQTGRGENCQMAFSCPVGYVLATNAPSLDVGGTILGSGLAGVDGAAASGKTRVVSYYTGTSKPTVDRNDGLYDAGLPVYRNSFKATVSPAPTNTRVSCYPEE